jgi:amidase
MAETSETPVPSFPVSSKPIKPWQDIAHEAQEHRQKTIAAFEPAISNLPAELPLNVTHIPAQVLTSEELEITEQLTEELIPKLASGKLSATVVVKAFLRRASLAQALVSILVFLDDVP